MYEGTSNSSCFQTLDAWTVLTYVVKSCLYFYPEQAINGLIYLQLLLKNELGMRLLKSAL